MVEQKHEINTNNLPAHIAIIMDGNGRWAEAKGKFRIQGHRSAITAVRDTVEGAAEIGIKFLTLYAFSTENWNRPESEVNLLMDLLSTSLNKEKKKLFENGIRLRTIGQINSLPSRIQRELKEVEEYTQDNSRMTLVLALSYGSRNDITNAIQTITKLVLNKSLAVNEITEEVIKVHLTTHFLPDPDLLIRTSGEQRISNFLLWETAYSELYFTDKLWPDFRKQDLMDAIIDFQHRERRYGKTSEQISSSQLKSDTH